MLTACIGERQKTSVSLTESGLNPEKFKTIINGKETKLFVLKNKIIWRFALPILEDVSFL